MAKSHYVMLLAALFLFGCTGPGGTSNTSSSSSSAAFQACLNQCSGGPGSGQYCADGCRFNQAAASKDTSYCNQLDQKENIPSCYGTVAKAANDITICNQFSNTTQKDLCVSTFGGPSTS